jgi:hypothetical protein
MIANKVHKPRLDPRVACTVLVAVLAFDALSSALAQGTAERVWTDLVARTHGPLSFRFVLQPLMAAILAIRDGMLDARTGRSPYFWTVFHNPDECRSRLREGLTATARILLLGLAMDAIYQGWVLQTFYPVEALIVAVLLAFIPYLLIRGPAARLARWWMLHQSSSSGL